MRTISTLLLFASLATLSANGQQVINLWSASNPAPHKTVITQPETAPDDMGRIGLISIPTIQLFLPAKSATPTAAVIICPGGGYEIETMYNEGTFFAQHLAQNGIAGVVLKYRIPQGVHQLPLEDAERAMQIVRDSASVWGIDPAKVGIMGFSAGGHLAAITATMAVDKPNFSVLFYPVISLQRGLAHGGSARNLIAKQPLEEYYSANLNVTPQVGPTLIFHCADDKAVSVAHSYLYAGMLERNKIETKLVVYPKGGHGWGFSNNLPEHDNMQKTMVEWIKAR